MSSANKKGSVFMLQRNLALHTDLYLPRWMYIYWQEGRHNERAIFDVYYRSNPFEGGYVVFAGLENIIEYVQTLRFTEEDITYLQKMIGFPDEFKEELRVHYGVLYLIPYFSGFLYLSPMDFFLLSSGTDRVQCEGEYYLPKKKGADAHACAYRD